MTSHDPRRLAHGQRVRIPPRARLRAMATGMRERGLDMRVGHIVELLDEAWAVAEGRR